MSQYSKPFRVEVSGGYVQPGEHYVCGVLFVDSLSAGCPDARTLAQMDGIGVPYTRIPWHDPDDVEKIGALEVEVQELKNQMQTAENKRGGKR